MDIEFNNKSNECYFKDLAEGDVFMDGENFLAMKIAKSFENQNAICLDNSSEDADEVQSYELTHYSHNMRVTPVKCKLVVDRN